jgi:hypothetical protein
MKKILIPAFLAVFLLNSVQAFAFPAIESEKDNSFLRNYIAQPLENLTITDDAGAPYITAENDIRLHIPDTAWMIFDSKETPLNIILEGTAVTNGRVSASATVTFEDKDKTLVIPIDEDFLAGESLTIKKVYVEGFTEISTQLDYLELIYDSTQDGVFDSKLINVTDSSTYIDKTTPDIATNVQITQTSSTSVELSWTNPTDLDLLLVKILRGLNYFPVSSDPYKQISATSESFTDTGLAIGDKVKYRLALEDKKGNISDYTDVYEYTLVEDYEVELEPEVEVEPEVEAEPEAEVEPESEPEADPEPAEELESTTTPDFTDTTAHSAETEISKMAEVEVLKGQTTTTFNPNGNLNRAEAAAVLYRVLGLDEPGTPGTSTFTDVETTSWYAGYVVELNILKLIDGKTETLYAPDEQINRAEFLALALDTYHYVTGTTTPANQTGMTVFSDVDSAKWYAQVIAEAYALGFIEGETHYNPEIEITRADAAKLLYNMFYSILTVENGD